MSTKLTDEERATLRKQIESRPLPGQGKGPSEQYGCTEDGYSASAESMAHAFLVLCEEDPSLLVKTGNAIDDAFNAKLWDAFKKRWPDGDNWLGGITGFQFGWAHGAVRAILEAPAVGNPALWTVKEGASR